jgi:hypothetical protein
MVLHPLALSVLTLHVLGLILIAAATVSAIRILTGDPSGSLAPGQPRFEKEVRNASVRGRTGLAILALAALLLLVGITGFFPKLVPGAMCATGVLQATQGAAGRALAVSGLALGLFAAWHLLDRLNRAQPDSPLATASARCLLLAGPVAVLAAHDTLQAVLRLDVDRPVDCCSAVYGKLRSTGQATGLPEIPDAFWIWGLVLGGVAIILLGLYLWRTSRSLGTWATALVSIGTILWIPVAVNALLRPLGPSVYAVYKHPCPWCLFLPRNRLMGYLLFGSLIVIALEVCAAFICSVVAARSPDLESAARSRSRTAGLRMALAAIFFLALVGIPAIL